jgi:SAM-dependent methyltransferase
MKNKDHYLLKNKDYFGNARMDLIGLLPKGDNKVLEIGCGTGSTGQKLKSEGKASEVIGVEIMAWAAKEAEGKFDKVICGDIEIIDLPFEKDYFDYVIAGDVFEHLGDPWAVLRKISFFIKKDGYVVASIPNIRHWHIIRDIVLKGEWSYEKQGILDETHLRFFTKKSIIKLFENNGFETIEILPIFKLVSQKSKSWFFDKLTFGIFEEFIVRQYMIKAKKQ